jgi:hypothetical protein
MLSLVSINAHTYTHTHTHTHTQTLALFPSLRYLVLFPLLSVSHKKLLPIILFSIEIQIPTYALVLISKVASIQNYDVSKITLLMYIGPIYTSKVIFASIGLFTRPISRRDFALS